jgi:hypothetical protein
MTSPDDSILRPIGSSPIEPIQLSQEQIDLCQRLDDLQERSGVGMKVKVKFSDMFLGALFVSQPQLRKNPDWIPQAANSLREILYHFRNKEGKEKAFRQYGSVHGDKDGFLEKSKSVENDTHELAHHGNGREKNIDILAYTASDFEELLEEFQKVMKELLSMQIDVHNEFDAILSIDPTQVQDLKEENHDEK